MRTYRVVDRQAANIGAAVIVGFVAIFFLLPLGLVAEAWLPGFAVFSGAVLVAVLMLRSQIHEVLVHPEGIIDVRRRWSSQWIDARAIEEIFVKQSVDEDGDIHCEIVIRHAESTNMIPCFSGIENFLEVMRQLKPEIAIKQPPPKRYWFG